MSSINMPEEDYKEKAEIRALLFNSAKIAKINGATKNNWANRMYVVESIKKYNLNPDLAKHIAEFVWTFQKR